MTARAPEQRLEEELANFSDDTEVHDLPEVYHLWSNRWALPKLQACGFPSLEEFFLKNIEAACRRSAGRAHIVSLGSGNCDFEIGLARRLLERGVGNAHFHCLELNPAMIERGRRLAAEEDLSASCTFEVADLERWRPARAYAVCLAVHSLHHMVGLEDLFAKIKSSLTGDGVFLVNDMIGRNGHMLWPEALEVVEPLWRDMPRRYKYNHMLRRWEDELVNWDCAQSGNEGVRAQDILPLLMESFSFEVFVVFGGFIDRFIDRAFGPNFSPDNPEDVAFIERMAELDERKLDAGEVKPTHLIAALRARDVAECRCYRHWTPEFCVRAV